MPIRYRVLLQEDGELSRKDWDQPRNELTSEKWVPCPERGVFVPRKAADQISVLLQNDGKLSRVVLTTLLVVAAREDGKLSRNVGTCSLKVGVAL